MRAPEARGKARFQAPTAVRFGPRSTLTTPTSVPLGDILMVIPNLGMGGAQRVFHDHARLLAERYRVVEVAFNLDGGTPFPTGNPLLTLDVGGGGGLLAKALNLRRRVAALRRIKRLSGARLCISHMPGADYVNLLSRGGERTISVVHGSKIGDRAGGAASRLLQTRLLQPWLARRADRIVTVSRDIARELAASGIAASKLRTINNFFDQDAIRRAAAEPLTAAEEALFDGTPVLITSGRLHPQKNQLALLDVLASMLQSRPVRLIILGDGELREALGERAEALGLSTWAAWREAVLTPGHQLYLLGSQANPFRWLARADLFAFPSSWEGFPLALCEAMICGLPVVSSDCPTGPREILAPDSPVGQVRVVRPETTPYGVLLPLLESSAAVQTWEAQLIGLLKDPAERVRLGVGAAARMADFTRDRIGAQWFGLVEELIGPAASMRE